MSEPGKYREWILETIDSLRSRKARPDLERICRMVRRRHGSDAERTRTELDKLIREQAVLKVSYKGSTSYRNAAKVQRKARKKSEFTNGSGTESAGTVQGIEHDHLHNNNNNSAHNSLSDQDEGIDEEQGEHSPDPSRTTTPHTASSSADNKLEPAADPGTSSGNIVIVRRRRSLSSANRTTVCGVGSGNCKKEKKASAPRGDTKGLLIGQQGATRNTISAHNDDEEEEEDDDDDANSSGKTTASVKDPTDIHSETCSGSVSELPQQLPPLQKHSVPLKPELGAGGGGLGTIVNNSLSEKLTRAKVRVVTEREVERCRLRRTRCGNISLPLPGGTGPGKEEGNVSCAVKKKSKSALQESKHTVPQPPSLEENEPIDEEEVHQSSHEEGGCSQVAMTTEPELIEKSREEEEEEEEEVEEIQTAAPLERPHQQYGKAVLLSDLAELQSVTGMPCGPVQAASLLQCSSAHLEERAVITGQLHTEAHNQKQHDTMDHTSSSLNGLECKTGVSVSSCLLTPTASPKDKSEEQGMNGGLSSGAFVKCEGADGSPADWTVFDVFSYFTAAGFPEQAAAFRTQEIDGKSLLLMQRNDVLTGLSIRLGPALKIYERHVKVLQRTHFDEDDC